MTINVNKKSIFKHNHSFLDEFIANIIALGIECSSEVVLITFLK